MKAFAIERAAHDFLVTLVFDKLFDRFPSLRIASVENGADFLRDLFKKLRGTDHKMPGYFTEDPVETFRRNIWINPFWEDDVHEVVEHMGVDRVIFGSDWPHIEGMPRPLDYAAELKAFDDDGRRKILRDNARELNTLRHPPERARPMADAATIASLATAGGTLVLAIATFASTRSANRSARIAERALDLNLRPVLIPAHEWDDAERVTFGDREIVQLRGGFASVEERGENLYFAAQLRNVGGGLGVLTSWWSMRPRSDAVARASRPTSRTFNAQQRHLYVPPATSATGRARSARTTPTAATASALRTAIDQRQRLALFLRYADQDGGHDTLTRFTLMPDENGDWLFGIGRHWTLGTRRAPTTGGATRS